MAMKEGRCRLCRSDRLLSYEHIPPRSAFNADKVVGFENPEDFFGKTDEELNELLATAKKYYQQAGAGSYTLCRDCNSKLSSYAHAYAFLCRELNHLSFFPMTSWIPHQVELDIRPLRVFKGLVASMISVAPQEFFDEDDMVKTFLEDRDSRDFDLSRYRISIAVYSRQYAMKRTSGWCGVSDIDAMMGKKSGDLIRSYSEIQFHPVIAVLSHGNYGFDSRFYDIGHFLDYGFNDRVKLSAKVCVLGSGHIPCAYTPLVPPWFKKLPSF